MRKLLFLLALLWPVSPGGAQNVTCATRPTGDNTNACASTAFVTTAVAGGGGGGGGTNPGGTNGQIQYNNASAFGGFTASGDATIVTSTGVVTIAAGAITSTKLAAGVAVANLGFTPAHSGANSDITSLTGLSTPLAINQGGSGTTTPSLVQGSGITITGSWPNQTIASSSSAGITIQLDCNVSGTTINYGTGCNSVTNGSGGNFVLTFTVTQPDTHYTVFCTLDQVSSDAAGCVTGSRSTTTVAIQTYGAGFIVNRPFNVMIVR